MNRTYINFSLLHTHVHTHMHTNAHNHTHTRANSEFANHILNYATPCSIGLVPVATRCWDYPVFFIFTFILFLCTQLLWVPGLYLKKHLVLHIEPSDAALKS